MDATMYSTLSALLGPVLWRTKVRVIVERAKGCGKVGTVQRREAYICLLREWKSGMKNQIEGANKQVMGRWWNCEWAR